MSYRILLAIAGAALCASAAVSADRPSSKDPNKRICRTSLEAGSLTKRTRTCLTAAEWEEVRRESRERTEHIQNNRPMTAPSG
jgi:hypothetical protein